MPDRSKTRPRDPNQLAHRIFRESIGEPPKTDPPAEPEKNPAAVAVTPGEAQGRRGARGFPHPQMCFGSGWPILGCFSQPTHSAFSKKIENHIASLAIHYMHCNFCRIHQSLRVTPAMAAGIADHLWSIGDIIGLIP
jgi:hypothetical protein